MTNYVNSMWELARHVTLHRKRVYELGMSLAGERRYSQYKNTLLIALLVHDLEKYLFLPWLWKYYGGKGDRMDAYKIYNKMNRVGDFIRKCLVGKKDINNMGALISYELEHTADVVDRHMDPVAVEEFCMSYPKKPMSNFLPNKDLANAELLKKNWFEITKHSQY